MPLLIVFLGVVLLLVLTAIFKWNAFVAFIVVSLLVGVAEGLSMLETIEAIELGIGNTLSSLVIILGFGAMLGKLVADSGAAQQITQRMVQWFGINRIHWALMITGFMVGIPMFYSVGFVILVPLVFTVAASTRLPLIYVALPMIASLSVTHGFLPPHPAPTAIAEMFNADVGLTLLYGLALSVPAAVIIVPLFSKRAARFHPKPLKEFYQEELMPEAELPSLFASICTALMPVILIGISAGVKLLIAEQSWAYRVADVMGNPSLAMLISVLVAIFVLGVARGRTMADVSSSLSDGVKGITMVLLIIGGAGALKQVLVASGVSEYIGALLQGSSFPPFLLAWVIAAVIRVSVGSATVAGLTAAGIVLPLAQGGSVAPELMVLAVGAGSLFMSHVNDSGFWLFKEYFNLSIKDTLATWTVMETTVSIVGLLGVWALDLLV